MTCIAGLVAEDGTVYVGGDSAGVDIDWHLTHRADQKVFTIGAPDSAMALGFTDSFRMGQVLRYSLVVPAYEDGQDLFQWMVTAFIDAVREALKKAGWATKDKEQEAGGTFLVGFRGRLFVVFRDYQVSENVDGLDAVGSGRLIALGALWASRGTREPRARIRAALEASERFNAGVRGPFTIVSVRGAPTKGEG